MNIVYMALVFVSILLLALAAFCFLVLHQNKKIETENKELKRKLNIVHKELRSILNVHSDIV